MDETAPASGARRPRPLSPHMQVYRPQLTSVLSITHRITGVALCVGLPLLTWWLVSLAGGERSFERAQGFMGSWFGMLLLFGFSLALFYHLCNGIRHLVWDAGFALDIEAVYLSGKIMLAAAAALTLITWVTGLSIAG